MCLTFSNFKHYLMNNFNSIFCGKVVVLTGHSGFKGSWLTIWLQSMGATVVGISNSIPTSPSHFAVAGIDKTVIDHRVDIRDKQALEDIIFQAQPDFLFHLAAQAIVIKSYSDPIETWETNVMGTLHVLESLRKLDKKCTAIIITSDKCYDNVEWVWGYRETDAIGGPDPYSASKGAAEIAIQSHIKSYFSHPDNKVLIASARAGNVIGGGDWALNRIIPDCVKAWSNNETVELRNPQSTRPWQHVLEPLSGYLTLCAALTENPKLHGESFNFGPAMQQNKSVEDLVNHMAQYWSQVKWKDVSKMGTGPYESILLKLNCDKALYFLRWWAVLEFEETVRFTAEWYRSYYDNPLSILEITLKQIKEYSSIASQRGLLWAQ